MGITGHIITIIIAKTLNISSPEPKYPDALI
jgi:hypothetical protein